MQVHNREMERCMTVANRMHMGAHSAMEKNCISFIINMNCYYYYMSESYEKVEVEERHKKKAFASKMRDEREENGENTKKPQC